MQSKAKTVDEYLAALPADRREALQAVRKVFLDNLPKGYEEGMQYGMIGYFVPHSIYPPGYHCDPKKPLPFAGMASQKNHMSLYLMCVYSDPDHQAWFRQAWAKAGKKLDMGKACVRFKRIEDVPLSVIGQAVRRVPVKKYIDHYETVVKTMGKRSKTEGGATTGKKAGAAKSSRKKKTRKAVGKTRRKVSERGSKGTTRRKSKTKRAR